MNKGEHVSTNENQVERNTTQARAGVTGHSATTVLVLSTVAAIIAFAAIYLVYFSH
jgi:hypothetical protein